MKLWNKDTVLSIVNGYIVDSPTTSSISYLWNVGSMLGIVLVSQIVSGLILAFHYVPSIDLAFDSIERLHRDIWYGALIRYLHANGAAIFFILVYIHIGKALYYGSYHNPRTAMWNVGVVIFILMMATAFLGYVLPFGVMSYWGAAVITSMFTAIPVIGHDLTLFVWGGYSVGGPTLTRFYALHFVLPFIILVMVILHVIYLHDHGSSNPIGITSSMDKLPFHPYFIFKDLVGFIVLFLIYTTLVFFYPNVLGHPDNYMPADPLVTPPSIVPEFYFLPFYAILRAIPNKLLGVIAMFASIVILFAMPYLDKSIVRSIRFKPLHKIAFWIFVANFFILLWLGGEHATTTYVLLSRFATLIYFAYFLIGLPLLARIEYNVLFSSHPSNHLDFALPTIYALQSCLQLHMSPFQDCKHACSLEIG